MASSSKKVVDLCSTMAAVDLSSTAARLGVDEKENTTKAEKDSAAVDIAAPVALERKTGQGRAVGSSSLAAPCFVEEGGKTASADVSSSSALPHVAENRRKKTVRMSQSQIDLFMSYNPVSLAPLPDFSQEFLDSLPKDAAQLYGLPPLDRMAQHFAEIDAKIENWEKEILVDKEMVQKQYQDKGYVEYEVYDEEGNQARASRRGRRRVRPGVVKHGEQTKRLS